MAGEPRRYLAYLLRLWSVLSDEGPVWRASVEDPHTGERRGFGSVEQLVAFLEARMDDASQPDDRQDAPLRT